MNDVIKQNLEQALQVCATEPIHQISNIQSHGATLVLSADSLRTVLQASANISGFIDFPAGSALGKSLAELIGMASALHIEQLIQDANRQNTATGLVSVSRQQIAVDLDVHVYSAGHFWVLELCNDDGLPKRENLGELLMHMQNSLLVVESDTTHYFEQVTELVQALTGYDNVIAYRFDANWNGEVIAQSRIETAPSYPGPQLAATDIPPQTRELYTKNLVRIVTDVCAEPIAIIPTLNPVSQQPLDMTYSALRSLAPRHMEYLHNIGIEASMMISLLQNGRLWGLIYCQHMTPKRVSFAMRDAALFISRMASTELTAIEKRDNHKPVEKTSLKAGALQSAIFNSANFSSIATDSNGVIQIFNVGAEQMLGYTAAEVMNKITPADISDPQEVIARAESLSLELGTPITPGFEALVFKASRGIEDIYELTYIRKDGSRFPAVVSVTALRDAQDAIIGYLLIGTDNTARKQAEEELLKAGALQSAIFNSANFSSIATDANGVIQIFNVGAENMLGYTAEEVMNKITPADISDPQEVIARANALTNELETPIAPGFEALVFKASRGIEDIYELTYIRKDGSRFPAVVSVTALRDAHDAIIGYLLIGTDNTARKQIEADQKQLEQRLRDHQFYTRSLFEANIDALMTTDQSGIITDVNRQMKTLTGCTRDELIGAPFKDYFTDPDKAEIAIKRVLSERTITNYEITAFDWVGKKTVVSLNATTFYDRKRRLQGVFIAARDITELKQIEIALRESTFLWKFAIEGSGDGVWDRNLLTNEMSYSIRCMEILGYTENDSPLTRQEWLNRIHPDDQLRVKTAVESYLSGEVKSYSTEYRLSCKDNSYKWIHERGMVVSYAEDGTPLRMIGTNTDISQRKFQEQKDKAHLNQLSHVTRLGLMGEMASGIAHEVNQPLTAISTYTQVSLNMIKAESPDLVKLVDIIYKTQQQALRAGQIIRRMREFVKSNTKQTSIADINKLIKDAVSLCLPDLRFRNIDLTFELKSPLPFINIDTIQIEQVIINLIRNSADALDNCPKNQLREISIQSLLTLNNAIEVRIKDNGQGISEDEQQNINAFLYDQSRGHGDGIVY
jgi:PAS domain S-box-containing protein